MGIYVERVIGGDPERLWELTQKPEMHERWDLRFSAIRYLPREKEGDPQAFEYEKRLGFGVRVCGRGETAGERKCEDGTSTSALVFGSNERLSLIRKGSGYWRYMPEDGGTRFVTAYDYAVRWGKLGWVLDRALFRPLMAWATAWSFDRLGRWVTRGVSPEISMRVSLAYTVARLTLAAVWFYEGVFPKLLGPHAMELEMSIRAGISPVWARGFVMGLGAMEVLLCGLILGLWRKRWPAVVSGVVMLPALVLGARAAPELVRAPFNVVVINTMTAALSLMVVVLLPEAVSASACTWRAYRKGGLSRLFGH